MNSDIFNRSITFVRKTETLAAAFIGKVPTDFAADGVHPTAFGAEFLGKKYCEYITPIINSLK